MNSINDIVNSGQNYLFNQTIDTDCPGTNCLRHFFEFTCFPTEPPLKDFGNRFLGKMWTAVYVKGFPKNIYPEAFQGFLKNPILQSENRHFSEKPLLDEAGQALVEEYATNTIGKARISYSDHFSSCQDAFDKLYQSFKDSVPNVARDFKESGRNAFEAEVDNLAFHGQKGISEQLVEAFNEPQLRFAIGALGVSLCIIGLWKCYQNRDTIAAEAKKIFQ